MGFDEDLESGEQFLKIKYKRLLRYYRSPKYKPFFYGTLLLTFIICIKLTLHNIETSETVVTLDEKTYEPFLVKPEILEKPIKYSQVKLKSSAINLRMQELNFKDSETTTQQYLNKTKNICVHLSHMNIPYDVIVFQNTTIINPYILDESQEKINIKEMDIYGNIEWKKRPRSIYIKYIKIDGLIEDYITLYNEQAYCFLHYNLK